MAYIPNNSKYEVGQWVTTTIEHSSLAGTFEVGTRVKITGTSGYRGYDIEDEYGNRMIEIGWTI